MPTISISRRDFEGLLEKAGVTQSPVSVEQIEAWLPLVKGELKEPDGETDELRVELQDSNRPDLWSCEGIARQVRISLQGKPVRYPFFKPAKRPPRQLHVVPGLEHIRPFVAACTSTGYDVTEQGLVQLIQMQEKLADIFGRKRRSVSIGLYRLEHIEFPATYDLVKPEDVRFTPLGFDDKMSLREILAVHPKGLEYGPIIAGHDRVPLLRDAEGQVLSLPPIINSREIGEVRVGDRELFVEVTGTDLAMVVLTLNILAVNLADRGATIEPVEVVYPYKTRFGKTVRTPMEFAKPRSVPVKTIESALGQSLGSKEIQSCLASYGYDATASAVKVSVTLPSYRNDLMHVVDVVEDVAISRGYGSFAPVMPSEFSVGSLSRAEQHSDHVRDLMVGIGFQEIISNILGSRDELCERMLVAQTEWERVVEVDNVMSQSYACLRQWMTPSLLRVEAASTRSFYPHRLFEVGEVVVPDPVDQQGSRTKLALGAMVAHAAANFSEIHSCLDLLLYYLGVPYSLESLDHPSFLIGRTGRIVSRGQNVGLIGELHPEVLERWQVSMPAAVFELDLEGLGRED